MTNARHCSTFKSNGKIGCVLGVLPDGSHNCNVWVQLEENRFSFECTNVAFSEIKPVKPERGVVTL